MNEQYLKVSFETEDCGVIAVGQHCEAHRGSLSKPSKLTGSFHDHHHHFWVKEKSSLIRVLGEGYRVTGC